MKDGISGGLHHHHETCCEKGGRRGRQACMAWRWFHREDVISGQVDLYMTSSQNDSKQQIEKVISSKLQIYFIALNFVYPNQLRGINQ